MKLESMFEEFVRKNGLAMKKQQFLEHGPEHMIIGINGESRSYTGFAVCFEDEQMFLFYTAMELEVPENNEKAEYQLMKKILEINSRLKVGSIVVDPSSHALSFRLTQYLIGTEEESQRMMEMLVGFAGRVTDQYYPVLAEILE